MTIRRFPMHRSDCALNSPNYAGYANCTCHVNTQVGRTIAEEFTELNLLSPAKFLTMQEFIDKWTKLD